jgi:uncharacterized membrane protein YkvA (DUF1232 family)
MFTAIKEKLSELKQSLPSLYFAYRRKDVPRLAKILLMVIVVYALSPIDLIPDFIPVLGYLDDMIILPALIYIALKLIPKEIMAECKKEADDLWKKEKRGKWYYAIPVILIWVLLIMVLAGRIMKPRA